jgi:hypothetical membrane protein
VPAPSSELWRRQITSLRYVISTVSVVIAHVALATIATLAYAVLARCFIGVQLNGFWTTVLLAVTAGIAAWLTYLSASRITTQRLTSLLVSFIAIGTIAAMLTTSDPKWWEYHFSQLGTFDDLSSFLFNGTLIAGGLLVTTFTLYVGHDLRGIGESSRGTRIVTTALAIMGVMLACVGIFPVDVNMLLHNLSASGMALMFLVLLIGGPWIVRRMPRRFPRRGRSSPLSSRRSLFAVGWLRVDRVRDHRLRADLRLARGLHPLHGGRRPARAAAGLSQSTGSVPVYLSRSRAACWMRGRYANHPMMRSGTRTTVDANTHRPPSPGTPS